MAANRFIVLRDCIGPGGVRLRRDTVVELDDVRFIGDMLAARKLVAADRQTERRIRETSVVKWTAGHPGDRPERPEDSLWIRRA
jgi:hypothetical protein